LNRNHFYEYSLSLFRVKSIRKEIANEAAEQQKRNEERKVKFENRENYGTKKFGRHKFEEPDLDLNLSTDITGSLRTMKVRTIIFEMKIIFYLIRRKEIYFTIDLNPYKNETSSKHVFEPSMKNGFLSSIFSSLFLGQQRQR
jgi:hypothetical protein